MKNTIIKKIIYFPGFILFFVLFFSLKFNSTIAYASNTANGTVSGTPTPTAEATQDIKLNVKSKALVKEKSYTLRVYNIKENQKVLFKSSDTEIASVNESGTVTGVAIGDATITVTVKDGLKVVATLTCDITVGPPAISVKLTKSELIMIVGKKTTLKTILQPYNTAEEIKFTTCDEKIASVSPGGRVKANALGSTFIVAMLDNGKFDSCKVTVVDEETYKQLMKDAGAGEDNGDETTTPSITPAP